MLRSFSNFASLFLLSSSIAFSSFSEGLLITNGSFVYDITSTIWRCKYRYYYRKNKDFGQEISFWQVAYAVSFPTKGRLVRPEGSSGSAWLPFSSDLITSRPETFFGRLKEILRTAVLSLTHQMAWKAFVEREYKRWGFTENPHLNTHLYPHPYRKILDILQTVENWVVDGIFVLCLGKNCALPSAQNFYGLCARFRRLGPFSKNTKIINTFLGLKIVK